MKLTHLTILIMFPAKKGWLLMTIVQILMSVAYCDNPLNGKHLNVIWTRIGGVFNESYIGPKRGGILMEYLSARFNFSYTYINVSATTVEAPKGKGSKGLEEYILDGQCDLLVHDTSANSARYRKMELIPWVLTSLEFLIPVPDASANVNALIQPFQWPVWICLFISLVLVILTLKLTGHFIIQSPIQEETTGLKRPTKVVRGISGRIYLYIVGMLLSQGGPCVWKNVASRILAGCWCLAACVLVLAYTSTLITYIITSSTEPLIESIYDIANNPDIKFLSEKNRAVDLIFSMSDEKEGVFKKIRDRLNAYPYSRCANLESCVALVKDGNKNVFANVYEYQVDAIIKDYNLNGRCELQLAKEGFFNLISTLALVKNTPYRESFAKGLLELEQNGLNSYWSTWFRRIPPKCLKNTKRVHKQESAPNPRLSLKNLTGAFVILFIGYILALVAFIGEKITCFANKPSRRQPRRQLNRIENGK